MKGRKGGKKNDSIISKTIKDGVRSVQYGSKCCYFITSKSDFDKHLDFGFSIPIDESRFEWIECIEHGFVNSCIVLDNDRAINIVGRKKYFEHLICCRLR